MKRDDNVQLKQHYLDTCLGYYDGNSIPRLVNPFLTNNALPEVTEWHETAHKVISEASTTGTLFRYVATALNLGRSELKDENVRELEELLTTIVKHSVFAQESVATFEGCLLLSLLKPSALKATVAALPPFYRAALEGALLSFGSFEEAASSPYSQYIDYVAIGVAIAALNLDFSDLHFGFGQLESFVDRILRNPPDQRFANFLQVLTPPSCGGLLAKLITEAAREGIADEQKKARVYAEQPYCEVQLRLFSALKTQCPDIDFVTDRGGMVRWSRTLFASVKTEFERCGVQSLDKVVVASVDHESMRPENWTPSVPVNPGQQAGGILDLALESHSFRETDVREFVDLIRHSHTYGSVMHIFVSPVPADLKSGSEALERRFLLGCLCELPGQRWGSRKATQRAHGFDPITVEIRLREASRIAKEVAENKVVLRTDDRLHDDVKDLCALWDCPLVILLHDASPPKLRELLSSLQESGAVSMVVFGVPDRAEVLALKQSDRSLYYLALVTRSTWVPLGDWLAQQKGLKELLSSTDAKEADFDAAMISAVAEMCYMTGSPGGRFSWQWRTKKDDN